MKGANVKKVLQMSAVKYAIVGGINTLVCWVVILVLMWFGVIPEVANVLGYAVGFANSYILNKTFTFQSTNSHKQDLIRFGVAMGLAYLINLGVLIVCHRVFLVDKYLSQIIAAVFYTASGYIISKFWAFKQ